MAATGRAKARHDTSINLRVSKDVRNLIDTAAGISGQSRTEFVVESARKHAEDVLLDQRLFLLDDERWSAFLAVLDNPPKPTPTLRRLMARPAAWEK